MIKDIRYKFENFSIQEKDNELFLKEESSEHNFEQKRLFSSMLSFGYIGFEPGVFCLTAKDIISFWNYSKNSVLKDYTIEKYYSLLNLKEPYTERIPSLKTEGSFHANDFKMIIVWVKTDSNMYSAPIAHEQNGLKLKELKYGDIIGTLYPEYYELYFMVDEANTRWKEWNVKQRYEFLDKLEAHSKKRDIIIPNNLSELLYNHKGE